MSGPGATKTPAQQRGNETGGTLSGAVGERQDCDEVSGGRDEECFAVLSGPGAVM